MTESREAVDKQSYYKHFDIKSSVQCCLAIKVLQSMICFIVHVDISSDLLLTSSSG